MFFWFIGTSMVAVALIFSSPALDYRLVALGSVIPLFELPFGEPRVLHSLTGAVTALTVVMLATRGRRLVRRRALGVPIGWFMHLVFDGIWADTEAFWWPLFGLEFSDADVPELGRGALVMVMELAGLALLFWAARAAGLNDAAARRRFVETGRIPRAFGAP